MSSSCPTASTRSWRSDGTGLRPRVKGILAILASAFGFAVMALCVRLCDHYGSPVSCFEKSFFRNAVALAIAVIVFLHARKSAPVNYPRACTWMPIFLRAILGTVGLVANFYALSHIDIAEGQTLNKTAPFFTVLFAWIFLSEPLRLRQLVALLLAFAGVVCIVKPGFAGAAAFPLAMGLLGGLCAGGAYTCLRALRRHGITPSFIVLFFSAFSCLAVVPFVVGRFDPLTLPQFLILLGAGIGAALGQFGITYAYGFAAPREIAVFDYSNVIFTAAFGYVFFAQTPDWLSIVGFVAILIASYRSA